ncbi:hypothetical protein SPRG_00040 [Saprolegnia parasitica CBS 223.65]|uniref:Uncharacterized protein n=1 Tax=Saprolegnia parasitica (strain CBS 223.65) TaxID=695850 RepID=A0A067CX01_SAPPC|nr:hypothetical protein SPRG_00040 [Saprolegnia parasitica CBS 223.65]KDO35194.1 hypothetical protein SPRG_00040 [Saprolegnia parasitica CBS 223.65]|eukprot:XP_012193546.1 hypothetical protein SPRG_00040 [Saprolegnia parasitica CBS 223.65]
MASVLSILKAASLMLVGAILAYKAIALAAETVDPIFFIPLFVVLFVVGLVQSLPVAVHAMQDAYKPVPVRRSVVRLPPYRIV